MHATRTRSDARQVAQLIEEMLAHVELLREELESMCRRVKRRL